MKRDLNFAVDNEYEFRSAVADLLHRVRKSKSLAASKPEDKLNSNMLTVKALLSPQSNRPLPSESKFEISPPLH